MRTHLFALATIMLAGFAFAPSMQAGDDERKMSPEMHKKLLEKFDKDGDGKLNEEERAAAKAAFHEKHPKADETKEKIIARFDKDGDGKLNEEERAAAKAAHDKREDKRDRKENRRDRREDKRDATN